MEHDKTSDDKASESRTDWEGRWQRGDTPWNLGGPPPILEELLDRLEVAGQTPGLRVLVPGAGHGHDALAWAARGHRVTAVDISPTAVAALKDSAAKQDADVEAFLGDLFALPEAWGGTFDVVWEQTCFCAIQPDQRGAYVESMAHALRPGGRFYGLFWNHGVESGPPWDVSVELASDTFSSRFVIDSAEPVQTSAAPRSKESLVTMTRR